MRVSVENVMTKVDCRRGFDADALLKYHGASRTPGQRSVWYKVNGIRVVVNTNGIVMCSGAKSADDAWHAMSRIFDNLGVRTAGRDDMVIISTGVSAEMDLPEDLEALRDRLAAGGWDTFIDTRGRLNAKREGFGFAMIHGSGRMICHAEGEGDVVKMLRAIEMCARGGSGKC